MPSATLASLEEVWEMIEIQSLYHKGLGLVDAHLLASVSLTAGAGLWTRDRRLGRAAGRLGLAIAPPR